MFRRAACCILAFPLFLSFQQPGPRSRFLGVDRLYERADSLFASPTADSAALAAFNALIPILRSLPDQPHMRDLLFQCYLKKGIESEVRQNDEGAKNAYLNAFHYPAPDSLRFQLNVFTGSIYYKLNNFDSANYYLLQAESLIYPDASPADEIRLYNTLGVLYYDKGNYLQCRNYFNQALQIVNKQAGWDQSFAASLQTNIATAYFRLGMFQASLDMYRRAMKQHFFADQIYCNMGRANAELKNNQEAMNCFRKVNVASLPGVLNEMAAMKQVLHQPDSVRYFLDRFSDMAVGSRYMLDRGFNEYLRSDLQLSENNIPAALKSLQRAIIVFSVNFHNSDIHTNPVSFTGTFAYHGLFDALQRKAATWHQRYLVTKDPADLQTCLNTYDAAVTLISYIEKSFDMDDAKILLKEKSSQLFEQTINVCLELSQLFPDSNYLERAFVISEKNKASVISANLRQRTFAPANFREEQLLHEEKNIKYNLSRINAASDHTAAGGSSASSKDEVSALEIKLAHIQTELEKSNQYYRLKYAEDHASVADIQARLDRQQALISFSHTGEDIHVFVITRNKFAYRKVPGRGMIAEQVAQWVTQLHESDNGRNIRNLETGRKLYAELIDPIRPLMSGRNHWIIIPDATFYFLPFESLPAGNDGAFVLETASISYEFSSAFLMNNRTAELNLPKADVLSVAPFANGPGNPLDPASYLAELPASAAEIEGLAGKQLIGNEATKQAFLSSINHYPVIHLATHAVSDMADPAASFIAFYPNSKVGLQNRLYIDELYALRMDSCALVIISACETGNGQLVKQEGVMSLSRAFLYAGCPSTVNSLWKADDASTAEILRSFHIYLQMGYCKSEALQRAKLDYIRKEPLHRSPAYWSHLIITGEDCPLYNKKQPWWAVALFALVGSLILLVAWNKFRRKTSQ